MLAGLTLGICVYTMGAISGTHINPAVTIGLAVVKQISLKDAACAAAHCLVTRGTVTAADSGLIFAAEALGAFILVFGVSSVVFGKAPGPASGLTIGGSLLAGISVAAAGSNGVLNPAVAVSIGSISASYIAGPIVGGIVAAVLYRFIARDAS